MGNGNKQIIRIPCPFNCKFYRDAEVKYVFVVTVVPNIGGVVKTYKDGEKYVKSEQGTESLHPFDVMDVLRDELDSRDKPGRGSQIRDCLWHVKSIKLAPKEVARAIEEDGGAETAGAT
jgi:hypothetical protein